MDSNYETVRRVMRATNRIDGVYYYFARLHGVNENALALLYALDDGEPHSQKEISREWMIPKTTINAIVKAMVRDGYIRIDAESHTKEKALSLTERGKAYAKTLMGGIYEAEERAVKSTLSRFSPEFAAALEDFAGCLEAEFDALAGRKAAAK